jgi:flavin-binding protein dodecin
MFGIRPVGLRSKLSSSRRLGVREADTHMSVARVTELSAVSEKGFEDAINHAIARATSTLRGVQGCWVKDMNVLVEDGNIVGYKVNVAITFVLEDGS